MGSKVVKLWDKWFLKTIYFSMIIWSIELLINGRWGLALFLVITAFWGIGGIGQALHPELSFKDLVTGKTAVDSSDTWELGAVNGSLISKAAEKLSILLFLVALVMCYAFRISFWRSTATCLSALAAVPIGTVLFLLTQGLIARRQSRKAD